MQAALWTWNEPYLKHLLEGHMECTHNIRNGDKCTAIFTQKLLAKLLEKMAMKRHVTELNILSRKTESIFVL